MKPGITPEPYTCCRRSSKERISYMDRYRRRRKSVGRVVHASGLYWLYQQTKKIQKTAIAPGQPDDAGLLVPRLTGLLHHLTSNPRQQSDRICCKHDPVDR